MSFEAFAKVGANNAGYFILGRELRDHCVARKAKGAIVNIGSMYGQVASYPDAYTHSNPQGDVRINIFKKTPTLLCQHLRIVFNHVQFLYFYILFPIFICLAEIDLRCG